jgi:(2R)-sulfolactate sulfo-lyase subunit alpha
VDEPETPTHVDGAPAFLIHREGDHVGVAVQDVDPGRREAVYMDSDRAVMVDVIQPVPLGHKVALTSLADGSNVLEYGVRVAVTKSPIKAGQLVHVHNVRSGRWPS